MRLLQCFILITGSITMTVLPDQQLRLYACVFTYRDDDRGDESPADFEEERRREAQHHLHIFKVVPVTCDRNHKKGYPYLIAHFTF